MISSSNTWNNKKVTVPVNIQMEAVECGAVSLGMVLAYYGKFIPAEEIREKCGVSRDGSKAINMLKVAREYGLEAHGYRAETIDLLKEIPLPIILHWNFDHFVVLTGIKKKKVFINDPASGSRVLSLSDLENSFTGIAIFTTPGPSFEKSGKKPGFFAPLIERLKGNYKSLFFLLVASILLIIPNMAVPTYSNIFIDQILINQKINWLNSLMFIMGISAFIIACLTFLQSRYLLKLHLKFAITSSVDFFHHTLRLPMKFYFQRYAGEIGNRVGLNDEVAGLLSSEVVVNFINIFLVICYVALMLQYDYILTIVGIVIICFNIIVFKYVAAKRMELVQVLTQENGKLTGLVMNGLTIIETLKSTGGESDFFSIFSSGETKVRNSVIKMTFFTTIVTAVPTFLLSLNSCIILVFGAYRVMEGLLTIGMLVAFQALMASFTLPVSTLISLGEKIQDMNAKFRRLDDVIASSEDTSFIETANTVRNEPLKLEGFVEVKNITFGYCELNDPVIENFSLSMAPGSSIAIVGASGSGKSTVGKLIAGLYSPWSGEILFDGKPRSSYPRHVLNNSLAIVDQDIFMFKGTVKENITMWDNLIPDKNIHAAAEDSCIHKEISSRGAAYENVILEGGSNYSGGQRQRFEITRALVNNPSIIILDEATSALDAITEKEIQENIRKRGCTCIIVAHRLSTIRDCDKIIVLDHGRIVQCGTHEELIQDENSQYAQFIKMY